MLASRYKSLLNRLIEPVARCVARSGVAPSAITLATPVLTLLACWWVIRTKAILPFCVLLLVIGCFDWLDGAVARASGRVTKFGGYLDSVADRYVEACVAFAVAWVTGYWALTVIVLAGSLLVSYTKARAAMEVPVANLEWPDLMERTERALLYGAGLVASALVSWKPLGRDLFWWTLVVLAALIHATVVQRVLRAKRFITARSAR